MMRTPGARRPVRSITIRDDWDTVKIEIMRGLLQQKFSNKFMRQLLDSTLRITNLSRVVVGRQILGSVSNRDWRELVG